MNPETAIAQLVERASGLDTAAIGPEQFGQALRFNMRRAGVEEPERYLEVVRGSPEELECLIAELAVPETWFFRDAEPFAFLARHVREVWLPRHSRESVASAFGAVFDGRGTLLDRHRAA